MSYYYIIRDPILGSSLLQIRVFREVLNSMQV